MRRWWCMGLLSCFGAAVVSVAAAEAAASASLADSSWELVSVQSMDDAIGTTTVEDPSLYTLRLGTDGNAAFRLNCNRGTASWESSVSTDGESGTIRFGPVAATRAMCPPPSLDEQLARDMGFVRGFLLRDGRLHLTLMADGGIYTWRPASGTPTAAGEEMLGQAIRRALDGDYEAHYFSASIDLDGDARSESVVLVAGPMVCGSGGCNLMVFTPADDGLRLVSSTSVVRAPVRVAQQRSHGWRNLVVHVSGGGAVAHDAELRFDGTGYPANPTMPPAARTADAAKAEELIPEFGSFREGKPVPQKPADYGNADDPVAGVVFGARIHTRDAEELRYVVLQRLSDRYAAASGIEVAPAEQDAYVAHVQEFMKQDQERRQAAGEEQPADEATPAVEESDEDRAARREIAAAFIMQWKINRALYEQYGGRIIFQQGGAEPLDAYRTFLEEAQARGDFKLLSKDLEAEFWRYYRTDSIHSFYAPGSQEESRAFSAPPWQLENQAITP